MNLNWGEGRGNICRNGRGMGRGMASMVDEMNGEVGESGGLGWGRRWREDRPPLGGLPSLLRALAAAAANSGSPLCQMGCRATRFDLA